jgi:hypothetical protein
MGVGAERSGVGPRGLDPEGWKPTCALVWTRGGAMWDGLSGGMAATVEGFGGGVAWEYLDWNRGFPWEMAFRLEEGGPLGSSDQSGASGSLPVKGVLPWPSGWLLKLQLWSGVTGGPGPVVGLTLRGMVLVLDIHPSLVGIGAVSIVGSRGGSGWTGGQYLGLL